MSIQMFTSVVSDIILPMNDLSKQPYKGARDFYPKDKRLQKWLFSKWRKVVESYGYEEYDAPILEMTELYTAKSGDELVNEQTYSFTDRGGRKVSIRPEMTPTVSRMVAGRRQELGYPTRWYSIPNLWRYERPQRGRLREHWQLNVDLFGVSTVDADLELIMIANDIMKELGASSEQYTIKINSRQLVDIIMADYLSLDMQDAHKLKILLDKKEKMSEEAYETEARSITGSDENWKKLNDLISAKSMADLPDEIKSSDPIKEVQILFTLLKDNGIKNAVFEVELMRGFDYYTDIIFEIHDNNEENNRSLFGGGRYDGLVGLFGVDPVPTVGFGMGDVAIMNFLEVNDLLPQLQSETDVYLVVIGDVLREAQGIANILREGGVNVAVDISNSKVDKQLKNASKKGIKHVMFVGEDELNTEEFTLKDMETGEEHKHTLNEIKDSLED